MQIVSYEDKKHITTEQYYKNNAFAIDMVKSKYFIGDESIVDAFNRIVTNLIQFEEDKSIQDMWFSILYNDWFRPGGSIMSCIGSDRKESLLNCTTLPIEGDTLEDISHTEHCLMKCAASRQGMGVDLSPLRPNGALISNAAEYSMGIVPWAKKYSRIGQYVGQRGRMPALLLSLCISHPDIEDFIKSKIELGEIEFANISVQVTNSFMDCLKNKEIWTLEFTTNKETISRDVDAEYLMQLIAETANQSAEPGVQFIDLMRQGSMIHAVYEKTSDGRYKIISTNACSEKPLPAYGNCNLGSINMENFSTEPKEYKEQLNEIVPHIVRMLDNVVEYELYTERSPIEQQRYILEKTRELGLGVTNLHGWLLKQDLQYDSEEAIEVAEEFYKYYVYKIFEGSMQLGKEKGNAPAFELIDSKDLYEYSIYFKNVIDEFYNSDYNVVKYMRNMAHISVAPTGSISQTFSNPCVSSGIEPIIAPSYWRKTRAMSKGTYEYYFVLADVVKQYVLQQMDRDSDDYKILSEFSGSALDENGEIGKNIRNIINKYVSSEFFKPAHEVAPQQKLKLMSKLYKWTDAAISCTFNLPQSTKAEEVKDIYVNAYDMGVRAVSVYREGSREGILIFDDPVKHKSDSNKKQVLCGERPGHIQYQCAPKRPQSLECEIHHTTVKGEKWLVIIGVLNNDPYELFAGKQEDLYLPKSVTDGIVKKNGHGKYALIVQIRNNEVEYKNIADTLMESEQKAITRIISTCLRHGVPVEFVTQQLKKSKKDITDFASAVSRVLSKYETDTISDTCSICGGQMVKTDGCSTCIDCQSSSCG